MTASRATTAGETRADMTAVGLGLDAAAAAPTVPKVEVSDGDMMRHVCATDVPRGHLSVKLPLASTVRPASAGRQRETSYACPAAKPISFEITKSFMKSVI
jgi:hypothetical protein